MKTNEFIAGGYLIANTVDLPEYMSPSILPAKLISLSDCLADIIPETWSIGWTNYSLEDRIEKARKFGIADQDLPVVIDYITQSFEQDKVGWPNVFYSLKDAREFAGRFLNTAQPDAPLLLGIGLHSNYVDSFLESQKPDEGLGIPGIYQSLSRKQSLAPEFEVLGYEILGYECGSFHSWLCNDLQTLAWEKFGIKSGAFGLLADFDEASKLAAYIMREDVGAEPALWMPWRIVGYRF